MECKGNNLEQLFSIYLCKICQLSGYSLHEGLMFKKIGNSMNYLKYFSLLRVKFDGSIADQLPGVGFSSVQHGIKNPARGR